MEDIDHYELDEDKNVLRTYYRPLHTYRQNDTRLIQVIPKSMEGEVMYFSHVINGCHMGEVKTLDRIRGNFYFPNVYKKVKKFIQSCEDCAKHKSPQTMPRAELFTYGVPAGAGDLISIDILGSGGGLPVSAKDNGCVLTIANHFNSFLDAYPVPDEKARTIAKTLVTCYIWNTVFLPRKFSQIMGIVFGQNCRRSHQLSEAKEVVYISFYGHV
ncbi:uncharacterized protein LOC136043766 [Artemia franciscana]|uniref:RNA-directed DNA polymerase n=1 Tax=Artemia franciscana TaxID=6661 RepID=A0AA88H6W6_ARTSF|nr:hypothetical protein QYM36_020089 [Artemia franciscana]